LDAETGWRLPGSDSFWGGWSNFSRSAIIARVCLFAWAKTKTATIFTGIPAGAADLFPRTMFQSEVAVSNFSTKPAQVSVTLARTIAGKTSTELVQKLVLAGQSSGTVKIPAHGDPAMTNSLVVRSNLSPGDVVSQFIAWGDIGVRTVEMQAKDNDSVQNGGGHPWTIARGTNSTLLLFNHSTDGPKKFEVLVGNGKQLWEGSYQLAPMETKAVKINEIVEKQIPDAKGTVLSKDLLTGQVAWWTHRAAWGKGRLMVSQPETGMARSFSCGNCSELCYYIDLSPDSSASFGVFGFGTLGDASTQQCLGECGTCSGTPQGPVSEFFTWRSSNTSIATPSSGQHSSMATFQGVSPGLANGNVVAQDSGCTARGTGPITVTPMITSIAPNPIMIGSTNQTLTIEGSGFGTSPTAILPAGFTSSGQGSTPNQIVLTGVSVAYSATVGNNNVTVTANGPPSPAATLVVDGPYHMIVESDSTFTCSGCATTVQRNVTYQVQNFSGANAGTTWVGESGSDGASSCTPNTLPTETACSQNFQTLATGVFTDEWTLNSDAYKPAGCGFTVNYDHWQWCQHSAAQTLGTLMGYIHTDKIEINGVVSPNHMPTGTVVPF